MEEKKILTDEELDNVVGGQQARDAHHPESANIGLTGYKNEDLLGQHEIIRLGGVIGGVKCL